MVKQKNLIAIVLLVVISIGSTFSYATDHNFDNSTKGIVSYGNINEYYEIEPNDIIENAQSVKRNNDSHKATVMGDHSELHRVHGKLSTEDDIDFYHVYLYKNEFKYKYDNVLTLSANSPLLFDVFNEDMELIDSYEYRPSKGGLYQFNIPENGYYYIKLSSSILSSTPNSYYFYIGAPLYTTQSKYKDFASADMSKVKIREVSWTPSATPEGAIVYEISAIAGGSGNTTHPSIRRYKNTKRPYWTNMKQTNLWTEEINPIYLSPGGNYDANQEWVCYYDASSNRASPFYVTPRIMLRYVYPKLPNR